MRLRIGRPQHGPVQHPQDDHGSRRGGLNAVNDDVGKAGDHQFPRVRGPALPAPQREIVKLLDGFQYPPPDLRGGRLIMGSE